MKISPSIKTARNALFAIIAGLLLMSFATFFLAQNTSSDKLQTLKRYFSFNDEMSVPTYFSVLLLVASAAMLSLIAYERIKNRKPLRFHWAVLAAGFWLMSLDEFIGLHERFDEVSKIVGVDDKLAFDWVVGGMAIVVITILAFLPFLFKLPKTTRIGFIVAGTVYVGGALVIETFQSIYYGYAERTANYIYFYTLEETFEMVGIVLFIQALLGYLRDEFGEIRLNLGSSSQATTASTSTAIESAPAGTPPFAQVPTPTSLPTPQSDPAAELDVAEAPHSVA